MSSTIEADSPTLHRLLPFVLFAALLIPSIAPIRSYDYFWHLATGRWIAEHGRIPRTDPFAVASDRGPWINGEWLFQLALYGLYGIAGHDGISVARGAVVAALFVLVFVLASRKADPVAVLLLTLIAWYAADHRLTARPETIATFFLVLAVWLVLPPLDWKRVVGHVVVTAIWINIHPSALLSPILAAVAVVGDFRDRRTVGMRAVMISASAAALVLNPYGLEGVAAPLRLMRTIGQRTFVNLEWLPSNPLLFPLLYLLIFLGLVLFIACGTRWERLPWAALFAFLAYLAVRHLRNQGFFFAAAPILLAPLLPPFRGRRVLLGVGVVLWSVIAIGRLPVRIGIDESLFPLSAVNRLVSLRIPGSIYNPDQFGGFLIWTFYPERRVLTDGRNELYGAYLREYERARRNNRDWRDLLDQYDVRIAVEEYRSQPIEMIDAKSGTRRLVPSSLAYFPPDRWALVGYDSVAMVFVRRDAVSPERLRQVEIPREGAGEPARTR